MTSPALDLWRPSALALAVAIYGTFSQPAPSGLGPAEVLIAALLVAAIGPRHGFAFATGLLLRAPSPYRLETTGAVTFVLLLWVPLVRGAGLGWEADDILRDVVPLGFLFLPALLLRPLEAQRHVAAAVLAAGLAVAGVAFTVRWWADAQWGFGAVGVRAMGDGLSYWLNSPTVLFAALGLPFAGFAAWSRRTVTGALIGVVCAVAAALCIAALAGAVHRVALVFVALAFAAFVICWLRREPVLLAVMLLAVGAVVLAVPGPVLGTVEQVIAKSRLVGANARPAEVMAVFEQVTRSPLALLVGDGWGALVANPAVGQWRVSYTHSFFSYMLLKTGFLGCFAMAAYLSHLMASAVALARRPAWAVAVLPPVFIGLALHTSFKFLCFGLLLTLMVLLEGAVESDRESRQKA